MTRNRISAPSKGPARGSLSLGLVRWVLPFIVTGAIFWWLLSGMDLAAVLAGLTPRVLVWFGPALLVFLAVSLWIEAICLIVVIRDYRGHITLGDAARTKAASYLLGLVNYALGAGALGVLLRRRSGLGLADAAGVVLLIGLFDLGSLLVIASLGSLSMEAEGPGVRIAGVAVAVAAIAAGFVVLRTPRPLGWLDRLRDLELFRAARTVSASCLARLAVLRCAFIGCFILLSWATMRGFELEVPPLTLVVNVSIMLLVAAIPIAVAGLGTGQLVFVELFEPYAAPETLIAASLTMSFGLIITRSMMGLGFAREFTREALAERHAAEAAATQRGPETAPNPDRTTT